MQRPMGTKSPDNTVFAMQDKTVDSLKETRHVINVTNRRCRNIPAAQ